MNDQAYMPVASVDLEIQELGPQEGAGNGGGSPNWMQVVRLKINDAAKDVLPLGSLSPNFQRLNQNNTVQPRPSIFMPRPQVAVAPPMPMVAHMASLERTRAAANNGGSTRGNVIVAAVGPYHRHLSGSQPPLITQAKKCAIVEFLADPEFGLDTDAFLGWARKNDAEARGYYERDLDTEAAGPDAVELAEMHLLDGCLVLFAVFLLSKLTVPEGHKRPIPFRLLAKNSSEEKLADDPSKEKLKEEEKLAEDSSKEKLKEDFDNLSTDISVRIKQTRLDLLLLGNQIPFFVLAKLHGLLKDIFFQGIDRSIEDLALSCFDDIRPIPSPIRSFPENVDHLLHLFYWSRVPRDKNAGDRSKRRLGDPESNIPCATWFEDSLISFSNHAAAPGTLQIGFHRKMLGARGVLCIPALHIHGYSGVVFHNLIAFEQNTRMSGFSVTTYCICMARLLQSEADAKLLRNSRILAHTHETDREIVDLFKALADEFRRDAFYSTDLLELCKEVEAHHHSRAARAVKWLVLQCFPRQTVTFFVILGAVISIATLINTVYSVYRFYHPVRY